MLSGIKRNKLKQKAVSLRCRGDSYIMIEKKLNVSRSTLSGWFAGLKLSSEAQKVVLKRRQDHLKEARLLAVVSHRSSSQLKKENAERQVRRDFLSLSLTPIVKEALLTMLYLGEGFKRESEIGLGNSNPVILTAFVNLLRQIYKVPDNRLKCSLFLRADQNSLKEQEFWSQVLEIPLTQFRKSQIDKRTLGKKTWKNYHGVCAVRCFDANLAKRLIACQKVILEKLTGL